MKDRTPLTDREKMARREYHRKWRAAHPEAVQAAQIRFWKRRADEIMNLPTVNRTGTSANE